MDWKQPLHRRKLAEPAARGYHPSKGRWEDPEERFVWWLWQTRRFDGALAREQGFDIVFPGWFSTAAGPDFRDALIADADGDLVRGDIEIHVVDSAWRSHGHNRDSAYDSVILHVVLRKDSLSPTLTNAGVSVPILELRSLLTAPLPDLFKASSAWEPDLVRCPAHSASSEDLLESVVEAGRQRFDAKVRRIVADVEAVGPDEALYRNIAEGLGYSANRTQFRKLSEALPFQLLTSLNVFRSEQLLLAAAGLALDASLFSPFLDEPVLKPGELQTFRVRPSNHPILRMRALARIVHDCRDGFQAAFTSTSPDELWRLFAVSADSTLVGRSRADDIVLNVALPYLAAYHQLDCEQALFKLAAPSSNRWVTALRTRLAASGLRFHRFKAIHHLGLQELSLRYCRFDHCEACPLHEAGRPTGAV